MDNERIGDRETVKILPLGLVVQRVITGSKEKATALGEFASIPVYRFELVDSITGRRYCHLKSIRAVEKFCKEHRDHL